MFPRNDSMEFRLELINHDYTGFQPIDGVIRFLIGFEVDEACEKALWEEIARNVFKKVNPLRPLNNLRMFFLCTGCFPIPGKGIKI